MPSSDNSAKVLIARTGMIFLRWTWWYTKPYLQERNSHVWFCSPIDKRVCWDAIHDLGFFFPTIVFMHLVLNSVCCWKTNFHSHKCGKCSSLISGILCVFGLDMFLVVFCFFKCEFALFLLFSWKPCFPQSLICSSPICLKRHYKPAEELG